jgi:DNA (cytosine-5)-methyltransferase 1
MRLLKPGQTMKDVPVELWHDSYRRRAYRRVMDGTPSERRGGAPAGLRRLRGDEPAKAITSGAISEFVHPAEHRYLTLRECARIQTFPDDFVFVGTVSECMLQIGNAVPPRLGEAIALSLKRDLMKLKTQSEPAKEGALLSFLPTLSNDKSPALEKLCKRVEKRFWTKGPLRTMEQLQLWE